MISVYLFQFLNVYLVVALYEADELCRTLTNKYLKLFQEHTCMEKFFLLNITYVYSYRGSLYLVQYIS